MEKMRISNEGLEHLITLEGGARLAMYNDLTNRRLAEKVLFEKAVKP